MRQGVALSCSGVSLVVNSCLFPTKETMVHSQDRLRLHILRNQEKSRQISEKGSSDTEKRESSDTEKRARLPATKETHPNRGIRPNSAPAKQSAYTLPAS